MRVSALQAALAGLIAQIGMWSVLVYAIPLVEAGTMQGIYLAGVVLAALTSFEAVAPLPMAAQYLGANLAAARRLMEVVDVPAEVLDPPQEQSRLPGPPGEKLASLQVQSLRFTYPEISRMGALDFQNEGSPSSSFGIGSVNQTSPTSSSRLPALGGLSFDLPLGKRLAIVGPSGAGKSTLLNLLLRFWEFQDGQILLDGVDLRDMPAEAVRSQMAVISQTTYLFSASLRDNLRIAKVRASQEEIDQTAEQAGLQDFIRQLPQGYDTWIGEHGLRLSGGERQRLAIARALLKDAPILILDEATANLDSVTEKYIMETIFGHTQARSLLMITHRLTFMQGMDEILVLDQGRVVERGGHADLIAAGGLYRRMWDIQHGWLVST
jgi:ABC-type multidrug transport system fused ATPase/permease subunit